MGRPVNMPLGVILGVWKMSKHTLEKIIKARSILVTTQPFYGCLLLALTVEEDRTGRFKTMATDGRRLVYCAAWVDGLTELELHFVLAHEITHCSLGHHWRIGARRLKDWNIAADYAINRDLTAAKIGKMPPGMLLDS
ncbi:MAG: hypothetical protein V4527_18450, partial [Pseudomonadota bacterium]